MLMVTVWFLRKVLAAQDVDGIVAEALGVGLVDLLLPAGQGTFLLLILLRHRFQRFAC